MKNVLVIYYSQSGQLQEIAEQISSVFVKNPEVHVDYYEVATKRIFPFPWDGPSFFGAFPETFQQIPEEIHPPDASILEKKYDLILLHYQTWYLSPSIPINSFLKSEYAKKIMSGTPVVTINGSRNMWIYAQEKVKKLLQEIQAPLVGNIALTDRNINLVSVITIVDWMFTGKKSKVYGFLPLPGVTPEEIQESSKFGNIILPHLLSNNYDGMQNILVGNGAVEYRFFLASMDKKANRLFTIWSKLILKKPQKRTFLLKCFKIYLFCAIWILSPIVHLIELILYPIRYFSIQKEKRWVQGI